MQRVAKRASFGSFTAGLTIVCYHAFCNLQNPVTRWLGRQQRTSSSPDDGSPLAAAGGMTPPPTELRFFRTLPGRLFLLSGGSLLLLLAVRLVVPLPDVLETFRKVVSVALVVAIVWLGALAIIHTRQRVPLAGPPEADSLLRLPRLRARDSRDGLRAGGERGAVHQRHGVRVSRGLWRSDRRRLPVRGDVGR